ncbi:hypothetical protein CEUSTIGMA_g8104.t1 [Chlamydomonas eustigma]|uniref:Lipocalin-like domain-containing protein n=1 Tax=Chlamydomonas eustigma TaxID=1157962 RepID=A0A250XCQ2_9CHLO|nr:hypothetical protein CEUSTIGMA_g8104.t1 [Chlamydomonas eustigma]|eukprot:GAX80669.1 hypothetical protein CEUSTIGMA_g8104.t1 [Chlamydomonas eustigma]
MSRFFTASTCALLILVAVATIAPNVKGDNSNENVLATLQGAWQGTCSQYGAVLVGSSDQEASVTCLPYNAPSTMHYQFFALYNGSSFMFSTTGAIRNVTHGSETFTWKPASGNATVIHISPLKNTSVSVVQAVLSDSDGTLFKYEVMISEVNGTAVYKQSGVVNINGKDVLNNSPSNAHPGKDESLALRCENKNSYNYVCIAHPMKLSA